MPHENDAATIAGAGPWGLVMSRDAWLNCIARDRELRLHHQDEQRVLVSWKDREGVFCHRHGLVTAADPDASVREKLVEIASSSGEDRRARRSIRREMAALVVASTGLLLFSLGLFWLNRAAIPANVLDSPSYWAQFPAFSMVTTGTVALAVASVMAIAGAFPWGRRRALCAALVLAADATALLLVL